MSAILGLKVRPPTACSCGSEFATIGASDGKFYATLTCSCGRGRGSLTEFTGKWIEAVAGMFGAATIVLRNVIPPVEVEAAPSIGGAISNAMNRKGINRGKSPIRRPR